jgi:nitroreductase
MELDKAIKQRKSIRKFKKKKPDWRDIIECIDNMRYAPMAGNIFTLRFVLIDDKKKIEQLAEAAQQDFISETQYVIIVCSIKEKTIHSFGERAEFYVRQQAGAAIQNFLLSLEEKGLATCWIGHFVEEQVKRIATIPDNVQVEAFLPIGYAYPDAKNKRKQMLDNLLYFHKYGNKRMKGPRTPYT